MSQKTSKTSANVLIGGKVYNLSGYEGEAYLQMIASYLNGKIDEMADLRKGRRFPEDLRAILLELNIADDYFKAVGEAERLEKDLAEKHAEIQSLNDQLSTLQSKLDGIEDSVEGLEKENQELLLRNTKLETTLEDVQNGIPGQSTLSLVQSGQNHKNPNHGNQGYHSVKGRH